MVSEEFNFCDEPETSNDAMLAQILQSQMDKEYNEYLTAREQHVNKDSKVYNLNKTHLIGFLRFYLPKQSNEIFFSTVWIFYVYIFSA